MKRLVLFALLVALSTTWLSACGAGSSEDELEMAPASALPQKMQDAPTQVREAYQFALANQVVLKKIPCYCGCGVDGHTSVKDCFVQDVRADGTVIWDEMGLGWSICVDIVRDTMRLMREGKSLAEIRAYVDGYYSQFGPATDTEPVTP